MPNYEYVDEEHSQTVTHSMSDNPVIICPSCGAEMHRKPQLVRVNWQGLPPHKAHLRSPAVQSMINNADENRERFEATKDANPFNEFRTQ